MKPHKHAEIIKAWADGAEIEFQVEGIWTSITKGSVIGWFENYDYRIKPEPKPDVVGFFYVYRDNGVIVVSHYRQASEPPNLRLTFDGETGNLKSAEVLK